jgi:hypothetical protein
MFDSEQKSTATGTQSNTTLAMLIVAFIFYPAVMVASRAVANWTVSLAITGSVLCVITDWFNWRKSWPLYIPSMAIQEAGAK